MKKLGFEMIPFWMNISSPRTNLCRQDEGQDGSTENKRLAESMVTSGGWLDELAAVVARMTNWIFGKTPTDPSGIPAEEYVKNEMIRRAEKREALKLGATDATGKYLLQAFDLLYGFEDENTKEFSFHQLTVDIANWVSSGHQRHEHVVLFAVALWLQRKDEYAAWSATASDQDLKASTPPKDFRLDIPCVVYHYDSKRDCLIHQMQGNAVQGIQLKPGARDYIKSGRIFIGEGLVPAGSETDFRRFSAEIGLGDNMGGSGGGASRYGYSVAYLDFLKPNLKVLDCVLNEPAKITDANGNEVYNPNKVYLDDLLIKSDDPVHDLSVLIRVCEPGLGRLMEYFNNFGPTEEGGGKKLKGEKQKMSEIELDVLHRSQKSPVPLPLTDEEAAAWWAKLKRHAHTYRPINKVVAEPKFDPATVTPIITSDRAPMAMRELLSEQMKVPLNATNKTIPSGIADKAATLKDEMDAVWSTDRSTESGGMFLGLVKKLGDMRDGMPEVFAATVQRFNAELDQAILDFKAAADKAAADGSFVADATGQTDANAATEGNSEGSEEPTENPHETAHDTPKGRGKRKNTP